MPNSVTPNSAILVIGSYPPRVCGIATYTQDLIDSIIRKFEPSFSVMICAIDSKDHTTNYPEEVKYILDYTNEQAYVDLAKSINQNAVIKKVFIQHEFGLFGGEYGEFLLRLMCQLEKPASITFHTVLPEPPIKQRQVVTLIGEMSNHIVVMTRHSANLLSEVYQIPDEKISVIPHGTHIISWRERLLKKQNHILKNRLILTTFGLLSTNKNIETALSALQKIVPQFPNVLYLVLGKTHPEVKKNQGEVYRRMLEQKVEEFELTEHVIFVDEYLSLQQLLAYLQLTDIYLFTSKDENQAVSGTFSYALSCACPIISAPIPQAEEMLRRQAGVLIDFNNADMVANQAIRLLSDYNLRQNMSKNAFAITRNTVWENAAIAHVGLFKQYLNDSQQPIYKLPPINLKHIYALTTDIGMIQFSKISVPDLNSGYTLDDNARALIAICMYYDKTRDKAVLGLITTYLNFIWLCQKPFGDFLNYVDECGNFTRQNAAVNLEDSNGRAIWALGVVLSFQDILPEYISSQANRILNKALPLIFSLNSPRAIAFTIKGLYFCYKKTENTRYKFWIDKLSKKLVVNYGTTSDESWHWFESYFTYANSILPEAMLYAFLVNRKLLYKSIAYKSFNFLLSHLFIGSHLKVISNNGWLIKNQVPNRYGEQPIDVSYTIQTLDLFHQIFGEASYKEKMEIAFSWFLGNNHLNQIIYDPVTGGCCDGLEAHNVSLNQGAESTVCYLMARLTMDKNVDHTKPQLKDRRHTLVYSTSKSSADSPEIDVLTNR